MKAYALSSDDIVKQFNTDLVNGLSQQEAQKRLKQYGPNKLPERRKESLLIVFLRQFKNPLIYILLAAAAIIFFIGDPLDALVISGVLFFNAILGTVQEGRTQNMLESLLRYLKAQALVIRDGERMIISDEQLVPGDILVIQEGEKITADARLIEEQDLLINESMLTGESAGVEKDTAIIIDDTPVSDQDNMIFKGTYVLSGVGKAVVVATGMATEIGKIEQAVEGIDTDFPLKREIDQLSHWILFFIFGMCFFLFLIGFWQGKSLTELLIMLTALFICVIPEGLPVVLTLTLVTGAYRMSKDNVLVKRLQAAEGLGRTDVIVIDKTGTLTRNEMIVSQVLIGDKLFSVTGQGYRLEGELLYKDKPFTVLDSNEQFKLLGHTTALLNNVEIGFVPELDLFNIKGDPTEAAMLVFAEKIGFKKEDLLNEYQPLYEIPFQTERRYQAGCYKKDDKVFIFMLGAPEVIIEKSKNINEETKHSFKQLLDEGLRVIAAAVKEISVAELPAGFEQDETVFESFLQSNFTFLGLLAIQDTIRPEVPRIIDESRQAGLKVIMVTGDHKDTALFVAEKVGIFKPGDEVIDGREFNTYSQEELLKRLDKTTVYSRVSPEEKLKIVQLFQQQGNIVAMTGDGVNDAPSLVAADIGIAMGTIGTEVAKQAADMILLDDSFSSIIRAIEQGRHIFYVLRRVIIYFFATNMAEVLIVLFALLANFELPLLAVQILWLNLITDGFLDAALSLEPPHKGMLNNKIIQPVDRLVDWSVLSKMFYLSIPMALGSLAVFWYYRVVDIKLARTMTLVTMAMFQWMNAWNCRSETVPIFKLGFFSNRWLIIATTFVLGLQLLLLYTPFLQMVFKTVPLSFEQWMVVIALTLPLFVLEELRKFIAQIFFKRNNN